ncbi:TadE-like domain-containing protein [Cupriavidus necator]|uniref:TadE/TadG family type IV pilus assembly protein n=1 Tax=Cupriavidus necator TaxID=106590 RepID=UPI003F735DC4
MQTCQQKQKGAAAVEFALVLPVLLLIVFGIVELGIALYDKAVITNASREGARAGIVLRSPKPTEDEITAVALNYAKNHLVTFGTKNDPVVDVVSGLGGTFGTPLTVNVSYQYDGLGLGKMLSAIVGPITIGSTSTMNNE